MDRNKIGAFLDRFVGLASGATTIGLLAVADRSGLLGWLGKRESGTAGEVAEGAGLDARYVREILSGLTAAGVTEYDPGSEVFRLPPEHALFLADETSPYFMGGWLDMIPTIMQRVDDVSTAVVEGGGVPFEAFGSEIITGIARGNTPSQKVFLVDRWLPAVPGLVAELEAGIRVADVGCGSGTAVLEMAEAFPASHFVGFDVSAESIATAMEAAEGRANAKFHVSSVEDIPTEPPFGLITSFDVIHDLARPLAGLERIRQALAPDGRFLMMEPNASSNLEENLHDRGALLYGVSALHCMTQSLAAGGEGLGAAWGRELAQEYAERAGFATFQPLDDIANKFSAFYLLTS